MKLLQKTAPVALALSLLVAVGAEAETKIGVTMTSFDNPFLVILLNGIKDQAAQMDGVTLQLEDANLDVSRQINQIDNFMASKVDAMIVNLVDGATSVVMTKKAIEAGIPLIYINHPPIDIDKLPDNVAFVGSNELDSGTMQTQEVCRLLNGKGKVLVMIGPLENEAARTRTEDIKKVIAAEPCTGMEIVEEQVANWSRIEGQNVMANWLTAGIKFDAIISNNDEMAVGAIQVLKSANTDMDKVVVAGIDATPDGLAAMKAGDLDVTVFQNAHKQGMLAVEAAVAMTKGEKVDHHIWVPFELVTPKNMADYMK
ncbi:MAG: sugar ABC transporter substrate-binding protein [Candidatus Competibacteraceae bacterium]|nr:sugar ABC transporter substrate-binding protein [Candidatus Competibacteraceae bacterium]